MLICDLRVNERKIGVLTARRTGAEKADGRVAYLCSLRTADGGEGRSVTVWHRPADGIWTLVEMVIQRTHPERWFPCPDRRDRVR